MITLNDTQATQTITRVHMNTNIGRINFYTDTGNAFDAAERLKSQVERVTWVDKHHASVTIL